ncbi:RNA polymerase sigma factor [Mesorhizobium sp. AaZ16]|uniref:RNA polymerase sigma factor n=1 Tax=Mesorhizobium sp. AaZ16 TaxID=3402289 RepID=UPI00374E550A
MTAGDGSMAARAEAEGVARRSYGKLVAYLAARSGDVAVAEDALSEAFAAALADWSAKGCPQNPEAWLLTVARRKLIDAGRRRRIGDLAGGQLRIAAEELEAAEDEDIPDRRLALMFACADPRIEPGVRAPLMLQAVLGLDAAAIASVFLVSPAAMGKRLVRAKAAIKEAGIPFATPGRDELHERLEAVLDAIYAAFAEGWTQPLGTDALRGDLAGEAIFLARLVVALLPDEPEALGLLALMLHIETRRAARRSADGDYVPLAEQDATRWDARMIDEAEAALRRASMLRAIGRYQLEAALQSAHVHRCRTGRNNWRDVLQLYDAILVLTGSPVAAVNRALAIAELQGADAGLKAMPEASPENRLNEYQPYWAARAELLARNGAAAEARHAYDIATGLSSDPAIRRFLLKRREALRE